jgi:hypothetical protein
MGNAAHKATVSSKTTSVLVVVALIAAAAAVAGWYQAREQLIQIRIDELKPIAALLKEDQELLQAVQEDVGLEKDSGILTSYLAKIRVDGVAKHAEMKQRLDRLAENNSAILALINVYLPHAKTAAFSAEADKFRRYAIAWRDRWNSVMELFMAGGNYPVAEVAYPKEFASAVQLEIEAADSVF